MNLKDRAHGTWYKVTHGGRSRKNALFAEDDSVQQVRQAIETFDKKIQSTNDEHATPLIFHSRHGHLNVVKYLLQRGANLRAIDRHGETALSWALRRNHFVIANELLNAAAAVAEDNALILSTLTSSVMNNDSLPMGTSDRTVTRFGQSQRMWLVRAVEHNLPALQRFLIRHNLGDINAVIDKHYTALAIASIRGSIGDVRSLLETYYDSVHEKTILDAIAHVDRRQPVKNGQNVLHVLRECLGQKFPPRQSTTAPAPAPASESGRVRNLLLDYQETDVIPGVWDPDLARTSPPGHLMSGGGGEGVLSLTPGTAQGQINRLKGAALQGENTTLKGEISRLQHGLVALQHTNNRLTERLTDVSTARYALENENTILKAQLAAMKARDEQNTAQMQTRQHEFRTAMQTLRREHDALQDENKRLTGRLGVVSKTGQRCGALQAENDDLKQQLRKIKTRARALQAGYIERSRAQTRGLAEKIAKLERQNAQTISKHEELTGQLAKVSQARADAQRQLTTLRADNETLRGSHAQMTSKMQQRKQKYAQMEKRVGDLSTEMEKLTARIRGSQARSAQSQAQLERLRGQLESQRAKNRAIHDAIVAPRQRTLTKQKIQAQFTRYEGFMQTLNATPDELNVRYAKDIQKLLENIRETTGISEPEKQALLARGKQIYDNIKLPGGGGGQG